MRRQVILGFLAIIGCTIGANLLLKIGAMVPPSERAVLGILSVTSAAGLALFGVGGLIYAILLRSVPLNVAQVFTSLQFVGVILASHLVLGEPISALRWTGIAFAVIGVTIVGATV